MAARLFFGGGVTGFQVDVLLAVYPVSRLDNLAQKVRPMVVWRFLRRVWLNLRLFDLHEILLPCDVSRQKPGLGHVWSLSVPVPTLLQTLVIPRRYQAIKMGPDP